MNDAGYAGLQGEWHDLFWAGEGEAAELPVVAGFLEKWPGRGLYVGSGSGRLFLPLVRAGEDLVGLEPAEEMRERCAAGGGKMDLRAGSWDDFPEGEVFDRMVIPAFTFQLFEDPEASLRKAARCLKEGGGLYLTVFFPWAELLGELPERKWYDDCEAELADGRRAILRTRHRLDLKRKFLRRTHRFEERGPEGEILRRQEVEEKVRFFEEGELEEMLESAGFRVEGVTEDFGREREEGEPAAVLSLECSRSGGVPRA